MNQPLRVAIIRQRYRPDGGAERFVSRALDALSQQGLDLTVLAREWSGEGNFTVLPCNPPYRGRVARERSFAEAACSLLQSHNFDLVQSHERVPCGDIYRAGDGVHREWLRQRARIQGPLKNWFQARSGFHRYQLDAERAVFENPRLKAVICNSQMVKQEVLDNFRIAPEKIQVIRNGVNTQLFHPSLKVHRNPLRQELGLNEQTACFLFVGSGFERKGLAFALQAIADAQSDAQLWVVGQDKEQAAYARQARRLGIADRVRFFGVQQDVRPYYGAADAFLFPTLYDPFPNVVVEALASGLPVITSHKCGGAELIQSDYNGYVADALDEAGLAKAVKQLSDLESAKKLGAQARASVEHLTLEAMTTQLIHLYQSLLSKAS